MIRPGFPFSSFGSPSSSGLVPILDDATRKVALQRTADTLRALEEIRRALELPPAALEQVLAVYASSAREVTLEKEQADLVARTCRLPMTMTSLDADLRPRRVCAGEVFSVVVRPSWAAYRVEEIEIEGTPSRWRVHDVKVGNRSQCAGTRRPIPGPRFCKGGILDEVRLDLCQVGMDFTLVVEYVGPLAEGEVFEATLVGVAVT